MTPKELAIQALEKQNPCIPKVIKYVKLIKEFVPLSFKKGDVFMHTTFNHPVVILKVKRDVYVCGMLTTSGADYLNNLILCQSRFMKKDNYFTEVLLTVTKEQLKLFYYMYNYDNNRHLTKVYQTLILNLT